MDERERVPCVVPSGHHADGKRSTAEVRCADQQRASGACGGGAKECRPNGLRGAKAVTHAEHPLRMQLSFDFTFMATPCADRKRNTHHALPPVAAVMNAFHGDDHAEHIIGKSHEANKKVVAIGRKKRAHTAHAP